VAAAKGIALAAGCPLVPFSTLEAMALAGEGRQEMIMPLLSAGRGEVYTALYRVENGIAVLVENERVEKPEVLCSGLNRESILFIGNGVELCRPFLDGHRRPGWAYAPHQPALAGVMAAVGALKLRNGGGCSPDEIKINYVRRTDLGAD
jgi:tRNA threonylcarbamoyladenosine biosynthesis protein TsaB